MKPIVPIDPSVRLLGGAVRVLGAPARVLGGGALRVLGGPARKLGEKPNLEAADTRYLDAKMDENLGEIVGAFKKADHELTAMEKIDAAVDTEMETDYWVAVVFETGDQRATFTAALDSDDPTYLDGEVLAARLGITLPPLPTPWKESKVSQRLASMALPIERQATPAAPSYDTRPRDTSTRGGGPSAPARPS